MAKTTRREKALARRRMAYTDEPYNRALHCIILANLRRAAYAHRVWKDSNRILRLRGRKTSALKWIREQCDACAHRHEDFWPTCSDCIDLDALGNLVTWRSPQ